MSTRGEHLVRADRRFATGGGLVARLSAPAISRVLDEIDKRVSTGGMETTLPDGSRRDLGFRADGPTAIVHLSSWMALVRLPTPRPPGRDKGRASGEWVSPP